MVFATTWRGNARVLYFRHAPPPSPADFFRDEELPKEPFKGAPPYMRSVYYFWWAFLRENEGYRRYCETKQGAEFAGLYEDFRDMRDGDFMRWWDNRGRFIFCERLERNVRVHKTDEDGRITDIRNPEEKIILSLPAHGDLRRMLAEVEELIIRERPDIEAKASWSDAKYQVTAKPVLSALHIRLTLWKLRKQHPEGSLPLHQLAQHAGLKFDFDSDRPDHRAQVVSRYLKEARCIIEHVGTGKFPITRPSQLEAKKSTKANGVRKGKDA